MATGGQEEGPLYCGNELYLDYLDCTYVNILVLILCYSFVQCYSGRIE